MLALAIVPLIAATTTTEPLPTSFDADIDSVHVSVKPLVPATEHAVRVPIVITATSPIADPRFVDVEFCASWPCADPEVVRAWVGQSTNAQITLWPQGFIARVGKGEREAFIRASRNPTRVVAVTTYRGASYADLVHIKRNAAETGVVTAVFVGPMLRAHPELLDAFGAVVATDETALDPSAAAGYRARGGVVYSCFTGVDREDACIDRVVDDLDASFDTVGIDGLPALSAASVALQKRPPRAAAFAIAFAAVLAIAFVVRAFGRGKLGFARMLAWSSTLAASSALALGALELVAMPLESHARVVTWTGPAGGWETGVDAVRPRNEAEVHATTPSMSTAPIAAVDMLGDPANAANVHVDVDGNVASARLRSSSALAAVWSRPSPHPRAVHFDAPDDGVLAIDRGSYAIRNDLDVPLDAVAIDFGAEIALDVAPGETRSHSAFVDRGVDNAATARLPLAEQRLLFDVLGSCSRRVGGAGVANTKCAAAVAHEQDGTLLGIEVAR